VLIFREVRLERGQRLGVGAIGQTGAELGGKIGRDIETLNIRVSRRWRCWRAMASLTQGGRVEKFPGQLIGVGLENRVDHAGADFSNGGATATHRAGIILMCERFKNFTFARAFPLTPPAKLGSHLRQILPARNLISAVPPLQPPRNRSITYVVLS